MEKDAGRTGGLNTRPSRSSSQPHGSFVGTHLPAPVRIILLQCLFLYCTMGLVAHICQASQGKGIMTSIWKSVNNAHPSQMSVDVFIHPFSWHLLSTYLVTAPRQCLAFRSGFSTSRAHCSVWETHVYTPHMYTAHVYTTHVYRVTSQYAVMRALGK